MVVKNDVRKNGKRSDNKFGTFGGVFVPSVLAILGAVLYLITPQVLGGVGLVRMIGIILIAHSITIATAFSISAIATNIRVRGGGLYYLISRSLGSEFGGSMGIQLFLAQTVAAAFYIIAFSKGVSSVLALFGKVFPEAATAAIAAIFFFVITYKGAQFVIKIQYAILAIIITSVILVLLGNHTQGHVELFSTGIAIPFWVAFAMFFPAVTGIDAGVGMSGELKDPKKSLVKGTFLAIIFTLMVYVAITLKLAYSASPEALSTDAFIMQKIALFGPAVILGILFATASSALSCFMTAPRTLRAMVDDRIIPRFFHFLGSGIGKSAEPRVALILSFLIAETVILMGNLIFVSQIVAMFFLNVYGWINGAAFFEKVSRNPSYRPTFNSPAIVSLFGMVACYFVMYLFNPWVMIIGIAFQILVFYILSRSESSNKLESVWAGVLYRILRSTMKRIERGEHSKKNWRPTTMGICANDLNRTAAASLLDWVSSNTGIMKMYFLQKGNPDTHHTERGKVEAELKHYIREQELQIHSRVIIGKDYNDMFDTLVQSEAIGNLPVNTVLLDFDEEFDLSRLILTSHRYQKNLLILRNQKGFSGFSKIDVWWSSSTNGNLMILIAYLISQSNRWKRHDTIINLFHVARTEKDYEAAKAKLSRVVAQSRIDNINLRLILEPAKKMEDIIYEHSKFSDLVLFGIPHFRERKTDSEIIKNIHSTTARLRMSLIVLAHEKIDLKIS